MINTQFTADTSRILTQDLVQAIWSLDESPLPNAAQRRETLTETSNADPVYGYLFH